VEVPVTDLDFLPLEYHKRQASQRDQWYLLGIGVAALLCLLGSVVNQSRGARDLRAQLDSLDTEYNDAKALADEVARLETKRAPLVVEARLYSLLCAHPAMSRVLVNVAASCPPAATIESLSVKPLKVSTAKAVAASPQRSGSSSDVKPDALGQLQQLREELQFDVEIKGVAESDLDVAQFIELLEQTRCFSKVELGFSTDQQDSAGSEVRSFMILCRLEEVL
jgi:Tfp pilus assembly protein PilN